MKRGRPSVDIVRASRNQLPLSQVFSQSLHAEATYYLEAIQSTRRQPPRPTTTTTTTTTTAAAAPGGPPGTAGPVMALATATGAAPAATPSTAAAAVIGLGNPTGAAGGGVLGAGDGDLDLEGLGGLEYGGVGAGAGAGAGADDLDYSYGGGTFSLPDGWEQASRGTAQHLDFGTTCRNGLVRERNKHTNKKGEAGVPLSSAVPMAPLGGAGGDGDDEEEGAGEFGADESPIAINGTGCCGRVPQCAHRLRRRMCGGGEEGKIGQWASSAIAGNDCASSVLYTSGLCASVSGKLSPIALALVSLPLFCYRYIYSEVVTALPLNGGVYNILLNVTSKHTAAISSVLIILSYVATAVVSADSGASYLHGIYSGCPRFWMTLVFLFLFACLSMFGVRDSAFVAMAIFFHHLLVMLILCGFSIAALASDGFGVLVDNWNSPTISGHYGKDLWFGFSTAMLGVTGFESAANFVESQTPGSFPKVLRNIWVILTFQNVVIEFLLLALVPLSDITEDNISSALMLLAAATPGSNWLTTWVGVDAVIVLCGAVLTAYVGILGLGERLARDCCLPQFLLQANSCFHTLHWIIICFFVLSSSLYLLTKGDVTALSGVYTVAFLTVLIIAGVSNFLLKYKRGNLPRLVHSPWPITLLGIICIAIGLSGNIAHDSEIVKYFTFYFAGVCSVVVFMLYRTNVLRIILHSKLSSIPCGIGRVLNRVLLKAYHQRHEVIFLAKSDKLDVLRKAVQYVHDNELTTNSLTVVHFYTDPQLIPPRLVEVVAMLDAMFPTVTVNVLLVKAPFTPASIDRLSATLKVPRNYMFVSCPSDESPMAPTELHGIRIIMR
ncbi:amino acid permease [Pelomyxa schiedti]|nr:amino acid permease [Pelomyxa schiedti]